MDGAYAMILSTGYGTLHPNIILDPRLYGKSGISNTISSSGKRVR